MTIRQFTASGIVVTPNRKKALVIWHKKLKAWLQPGGHIDANELPHVAALREVLEETGLATRIVSCGVDIGIEPGQGPEVQIPTPYCIMEQDIPATPKEGAHKHMDMMYLMVHEEIDPPALAQREVGGAKWISREEVQNCDTFPGFKKLLQAVLEPASSR